MFKPERLLVTCTTKGGNQDKSSKEVVYLFKTLNQFGGTLAKAQKIACFNDKPEASYVQKLEEIGVNIELVERISDVFLLGNKIGMLSLYDKDFDYLIAIDVDIVVLRDFSNFIKGNQILAKPVDTDPLNLQQWQKLFAHFNISFPSKRYITCFQNKETIPYFNSGLLIIPKKFVFDLYTRWKRFIPKVLAVYEKFPDISKYSFHTDQFALAFAIAEGNLPSEALPLEMNFPTHRPIHPIMKPENLNPYLLHYHHLLSEEGKILHCQYDNINSLIDKVNNVLIN